ncbi:MAG TPA: FkbM family methyltransferase [Anaerohalosphaeraceae bacterium]|nr:FkbM family methyltransferase [Anaerohalosphaeraceae bacterium]
MKHPLFSLKKKWRRWRGKRHSYPVGSFQGLVGKIRFEFRDTPRYRKFFEGTYEFAIQESIRKFLPKNGIFIDVGANLGYIAAIAADRVGPEGAVHCFEPAPEYFSHLERLRELNPSYRFFLNNVALGESSGEMKRLYLHRTNPGGSSLLKGFISSGEIQSEIEVQSERLDSYLHQKQIHPSMIKIDTEGYEWAVLRGCSEYFKQNKHSLPPVLVEVSRNGMAHFGITPADFEGFMASFGYKPYCVFGIHRLNLAEISSMEDILFLA